MKKNVWEQNMGQSNLFRAKQGVRTRRDSVLFSALNEEFKIQANTFTQEKSSLGPHSNT